MAEIPASAARAAVSFERRERVRRGLGRVMAAAKALGAGELEAACHEIGEVRRLDVFGSDVMEPLEQIRKSLQRGETRGAAAQLQTVAAAMREELSRCAAAPAAAGDTAPRPAAVAAPRPVAPLSVQRPVALVRPEPETAPPIEIAPPQPVMPDAERALALAQLLGKAEPPRTQRATRRMPAAYAIAAGMAGAILLVSATDWRTLFDNPRQPPPKATEQAITRTSGNAPAPPPVAQAFDEAPEPPPVAQTSTFETDVPIALPTRGTLPPSTQRDDVTSRAMDGTDAARPEPRVVTPRPQLVPNVQRSAQPTSSSEPPANLRERVEELPIVPIAIEPPSARPAEVSPAPTAPSEADQIERALGQYRQAYERLDARGARAVWPGVNERALARAFAGLESQGLVFDRCDVNVGGDSATAVCNGSARYVPKVGSRVPQVEPRRWTFSLRKSANGWEIANVDTGRQ